MSIEFKGMENVLEMFDSAENIEKLQKALEKACLLVERRAKQLAPKGRTGELRKSISSKVEDLTGEVFSPLEYAPYVEYGTGLFAENGGRTDVPWSYQDEKGDWHTTCGQHPQPFMRPALDENREEIIRLLWEGLTSD